MTVVAFEGPAGCGKTHRLMEEVAVVLARQPLAQHQRVLAVTYMHGSRRRLEERLRDVPGLAGRFEAMTLDSFAWRLITRWRSLARYLGHAMPEEGTFEAICALAANLLARQEVREWVHLTFPLVVVDEAQDFNRAQSAILEAHAQTGTILLAYDEFQCLDTDRLPIAIASWLGKHCQPTVLLGCHRTSCAGLLHAARAIRNGEAVPRKAQQFETVATPGHVNFVAAYLAGAIAWRGDSGNVAVLTPSRKGGFADNAIICVGEGPVGKKKRGPYTIVWESAEGQETEELWKQMAIADSCSVTTAIDALKRHRVSPIVKRLCEWLARRRSTLGAQTVVAADLRRELERAVRHRRHYGGRSERLYAAMTIKQAKNREFDHVIVLWPFTVRDDAAERRRLLYNAVTRAKRSCTVLVQSEDLLRVPPFA